MDSPSSSHTLKGRPGFADCSSAPKLGTNRSREQLCRAFAQLFCHTWASFIRTFFCDHCIQFLLLYTSISFGLYLSGYCPPWDLCPPQESRPDEAVADSDEAVTHQDCKVQTHSSYSPRPTPSVVPLFLHFSVVYLLHYRCSTIYSLCRPVDFIDHISSYKTWEDDPCSHHRHGIHVEPYWCEHSSMEIPSLCIVRRIWKARHRPWKLKRAYLQKYINMSA